MDITCTEVPGVSGIAASIAQLTLCETRAKFLNLLRDPFIVHLSARFAFVTLANANVNVNRSSLNQTL
jgi:hypothetical protein